VLPQEGDVIVVSDVACPDRRSKVAFLGEIKRTIPWSRPTSGRAPRAGLVQDAACGTGAQRRLVLDETEHGAMLFRLGHQASSKTAIAARSVFGVARWPTKVVLRRSIESALRTLIVVMDHPSGSSRQ
jgi:hypothetical protein